MKEVMIIGVIALMALTAYGYAANVYKVFGLDFASPYKAEVIRTVGVFVPPVGVIAGFVTFDEEKK